ncbi:nucleotidyl cyclase domain-containing protein [Kitasatospora azatica]|uniref:hypothetical protein n=1 Tax=Kitasatospora azatica TaxID=58347 RepID=UPI00055BA0B7|nr:hypothetical protein [Kitasatospora azatica]
MHDEAVDAVYELVISVDVRRSSDYDDRGKTRMREQLYGILGQAFAAAGVPDSSVHREDRGDGVLAAIAGSVPPARLLGVWLTEVHENLRRENPALLAPLGLRIGLHIGPVTHDAVGISGAAVDLACRLADAQQARELLDQEQADLVVVASDRLYHEVITQGGRFIEPEHYAPAQVRVKETETAAWFLLPGRPRPSGVPGAQPGARAAAQPGLTAQPGMTVHGDMSVHHDNTYRGPVHIGRKGQDA